MLPAPHSLYSVAPDSIRPAGKTGAAPRKNRGVLRLSEMATYPD